MAATPTYSWPTPDDTDNVADGAAAIRALGSAIDGSVADLAATVSGQPYVRQVVYEQTASTSIAATTETTILSATITPSEAGNLLIVQTAIPLSVTLDSGSSTFRLGFATLKRNGDGSDGTVSFGRLLVASSSVSAETAGVVNHFRREVAASTSSVTFTVTVTPSGGATIRKGGARIGSLLIMEVQQ